MSWDILERKTLLALLARFACRRASSSCSFCSISDTDAGKLLQIKDKDASLFGSVFSGSLSFSESMELYIRDLGLAGPVRLQEGVLKLLLLLHFLAGLLVHAAQAQELIRENGSLAYQRFLLDCTAQKQRENQERLEKWHPGDILCPNPPQRRPPC